MNRHTPAATRWWHRQDHQIVCDLCPRACALHEGQRGFCFVRQNVAGEMVLTTYGRSSGFCVDPIEKKPLNHFLPGTPVLSFGTAGCNLGCKFCQNWSISKAKEFDSLADAAGPEAIARAAKDAGCRSVAFTYNDPVIWAEYAIDTAIACREAGLKTVAVTAGYITPEARPDFYAVMDAANVDLKGFTEDFYQHLTLSHLEPVLDTLRWLKHESNVWFEITNLMIPGANDSLDETAKMCDWIAQNLGPDVPVHFTAFHPDFRMMDVPHTPPETLTRAREQALAAGLRYAYVGNVHDAAGQSTYCPKCKTLLIERDWYRLGTYALNNGRCEGCGTKIPGVFEDEPGDWGPRRQPIRITPAVIPLNVGPMKTRSKKAESSTGSQEEPLQRANTNLMEAHAENAALTDAISGKILEYALEATENVLRGQSPPPMETECGQIPVYGVFVTYRRGRLLRACRGRLGHVAPLGELFADAVIDSVRHDPRFPSVVPEELPYLSIEVSLLSAPREIVGQGDERAADVDVGRHGLIIHHPRGRGLLLPKVASEAGWDAAAFLQAVSRKAGLPMDAWRDEQSRLMKFEATVLESEPVLRETDAEDGNMDALQHLARLAEGVLRGRLDSPADLPALLGQFNDGETGVVLRTRSGHVGSLFGKKIPFSRLAVSIARNLRQEIGGKNDNNAEIDTVALLTHPIPLKPDEFPDRYQTLRGAGLVTRHGGKSGLHLADNQQAAEAVPAALRAVGCDLQQWREAPANTQVVAYSVRSYRRPGPVISSQTRHAARAGQFYPAAPDDMRRAVAGYLNEQPATKSACRAVLLPHAGWMFCGSVIGRTLARVAVPRTVIVIGPKHTPYGENWSVSSADVWELPGISVPVASGIRDRLVQLVPGLAADAEAHRLEHGTEVLVPFLFACNPELKIVPVALGSTSYSQTERFARAISVVIAESLEPILLVISSDMNHFAPEPENRRRDFLGIDAFQTGDPARLFDTATAHDISMCGLMPAVTVLRALHLSHDPPRPELIHYDNSATVSGNFERVVGYAGCVIP